LSKVLSSLTIVIFFFFLFFFIFFWFLPHTRNLPNTSNQTNKKEEAFLTVSSPEDNLVTDIASVKIAGRTNPQAVIAIYSQDNEEVLEASQDGSFSTEFPLKEKLNEITIITQTVNGEEKSVIKDIYYTKEELGK